MPADRTAVPTASAPPGVIAAFFRAFSENRAAVAGLILLTLLVLVAIFANLIAPYDPTEQFREFVRIPPAWMEGGNAAFPLGTDEIGRDMLSRLIFGARLSLFIGLSVVVASMIVGIALGLIAAFFPGWPSIVIMRAMDVILSVPSLLLAIVIVAIIGPSLTNTIVAITVVYLPNYVRLVRASALSEKSRDYVTAARVAGAGTLYIMFRTVLPNCMAPIIVQAALTISNAILEAAALGFLGLGAQPPSPEWGAMLASAREFLQSASWIVTEPGLAILITVISINLVGDGLRDALDPKMRRS
ncbi:dipeptide ABC transporter permease DppC [Kaistia algarum]|uniref:ABC transporter permease subunit n=1 Tax=Kaistia algarum TaxID=2083279 RepID=UPI000CE758E4|nr:ABC transporter permease subunit [Kaistia algarum]MCX5514191.1 ABC transporter permease subunit [Kaistia algarum]PPE77952.1 dipeptide ABC transporter permease DppC [Kaistia algarum]